MPETRDPRRAARRILRRRRRPIAAVLAGAGVLLALSTLHATPAPVADDAAHGIDPLLAPGHVVVPVVLATGAVASALAVGDIVDIVDFSDTEPVRATVVARGAWVYGLPAGTSFGGGASAVVLVSVPERQALPVSAASATGGIGVVLRSRRGVA